MRAVLQRVTEANIYIDGSLYSSVGNGLLVYLGIEDIDREEDADWLVLKLVQMRIFADEAGKMNLSVGDTGGEILLVSQFTLFASTKKGNRPSFVRASAPETAVPLYEYFVRQLQHSIKTEVKTGKFGANMQVSSVNDGPVTILIDSRNKE